jgi:putative ABC transport system permease protein
MRPTQDDFDDEIRSHLALSVKDRIDRGEDPEAARLAALKEFGNVTLTRDSMRSVWRHRWVEGAAAVWREIRIGMRALRRARGLAAAVVITLALGIGANAAMFSVASDVLFAPLVNRDADRLIYIRQHAPGIGVDNLTFSVPEIEDLRSRVTTIAAFGEFSTIDFTMVGLGGPRVVRAGVVNGSFFDVMGLRPALGRLLGAADDGPEAAPAVVLTHRFWVSSLDGDPAVVGRTVRLHSFYGLGSRTVTIVGVLEPSLPYPADTEIIGNVVTSPHHLDATMITGRTHRMTELFGRLEPDASLEAARTELAEAHAAILREHPEAHSPNAGVQVSAALLRDQLVAPVRPVLVVLMAAAGLVFLIGCSNVANLILACSVRREGELAVRAALGASHRALRRTLLAESVLLCGAGAALGVLLAGPLAAAVAGYTARFSVRALDVSIDARLLWVAAALAMGAAVLLAYIPRLPSPHAPAGLGLASGGVRITPGTRRRLHALAMAQVSLSFMLVAGGVTLVTTLISLQNARTGYHTTQVLVFDVPSTGRSSQEEIDFTQEVRRRIARLPGVEGVALGNVVPWRDAGSFGPPFPFSVEGYQPPGGEGEPRARLRIVTPGFFAVLGIPMLDGRDFTDGDGMQSEPVVIVSQGVAERLFPNGDAVNRHLTWTEPTLGSSTPRRIVGVVGDVDDENIMPAASFAVYHPFRQMTAGGRLFVRASVDPYALVPPVTRTIHEMSPDQPVERAATLEDVRMAILAPERLHAFAVSGLAGVALLIAVVGIAGMLAFSVSARTREFGVRLAVGSTPRHLLVRVVSEGTRIAAFGVVAGTGGGYLIAWIAGRHVEGVQMPGALPMIVAAGVLMAAAILASFVPAARASRVDVMRALGSD